MDRNSAKKFIGLPSTSCLSLDCAELFSQATSLEDIENLDRHRNYPVESFVARYCELLRLVVSFKELEDRRFLCDGQKWALVCMRYAQILQSVNDFGVLEELLTNCLDEFANLVLWRYSELLQSLDDVSELEQLWKNCGDDVTKCLVMKRYVEVLPDYVRMISLSDLNKHIDQCPDGMIIAIVMAVRSLARE